MAETKRREQLQEKRGGQQKSVLRIKGRSLHFLQRLQMTGTS